MTLQRKWIFRSILGVVIAFFFLISIFIVKEGQYRVVLKFGEAVRIQTGLVFILKSPSLNRFARFLIRWCMIASLLPF